MPKWTAKDVRQHLQWACDLELFTLPLYLAAAYSIKAPIVNGSPMCDPHIGWEFDDNWSESQRAQWAFNIVYSVAIQEMLHLMLARNVATALGRTVWSMGDHLTQLWANNTQPDFEYDKTL